MRSLQPVWRLSRRAVLVGVAAALAASAGCGGNGVGSDESARRAYLGLDRAVERALNLGMDGFNAASSANIPAQTGMGDASGTMTVTGQVDQGASANKQMRLQVALVNYADAVTVSDGGAPLRLTYATSSAPAALNLSLRGIPNGTFTGDFSGTFSMTGDLTGDVTLSLTLAGQMQPGTGGAQIQRVVGSTTITGTAASRYGTYQVTVTR